MPARIDLSWEPRSRRWWKMFKGRRYQISCKQLSKFFGREIPQTKEGSYQAANEWWRLKLLEIQGLEPTDPKVEYRRLLEQRRDWARQHGDEEAVEQLTRALDGRLGKFFGLDLLDIFARQEKPKPPPFLFKHLPFNPNDKVWEDRLSREKVVVEPDRKIGAWAKRFLDQQDTKRKNGKISASQFTVIRDSLNDFVDWMGSETGVDAIDSARVEAYWTYLATRDLSKSWKEKRLQTARRFIEYLSTHDVIPQPKNLRSRDHTFAETAKGDIETFTVAEVKTVLKLVTNPAHRVAVLLMLNCGMTQIDVSDLKPSEVDWTNGTITRKRSKRMNDPNAPTVTYPLWTETFSLLKQERSDDPEHVLLTTNGTPWVKNEIKEGGGKSTKDGIAAFWSRLRPKAGLDLSIKHIRKTSASLLNTRPDYARFAQYFLAHKPSTIADRHYVKPDGAEFERAVRWLGEQYGIA